MTEVTFWYLMNSLVHLSSDSEYNCLNFGCVKVIFMSNIKILKITSIDLTVSQINCLLNKQFLWTDENYKYGVSLPQTYSSDLVQSNIG